MILWDKNVGKTQLGESSVPQGGDEIHSGVSLWLLALQDLARTVNQSIYMRCVQHESLKCRPFKWGLNAARVNVLMNEVEDAWLL